MGQKRKPLPGETRQKISEALKGTKYVEGIRRSPWSKERKQEQSKAVTGDKNPAWKGGLKKDKEHMKALGRLRNHRRRAREKQADSSFTVGEWELLKEQYGHVCPMCRKEEPEINLTMDHVIPLSKGGKNNISNIQPLCLDCNDRKFTKIFRITPDGDMLLF